MKKLPIPDALCSSPSALRSSPSASSLIITFILLFHFSAKSQFFAKVDEDFEFNGTDLSKKGHDHTIGCTLLEENEAYSIYAPKKPTLKIKNYTLTNILYFVNSRKEIFKIQAMNLGDFIEKAHLKLDIAKGAKFGDVANLDDGSYLVYKHMRTTDVYAKLENSDTSYVWILMDWYLDQTEDYRSNHDLLPVLGTSVKDSKTYDFLFAYEIPDIKRFVDDLKWMTYYHHGMELFLRNDSILQATVYNNFEKFKQFKDPLPFNLKVTDTRSVIKEKLGAPPSTSTKNNTWYYRKPNLQLHVYFEQGDEATDEDKVHKIVYALKKD